MREQHTLRQHALKTRPHHGRHSQLRAPPPRWLLFIIPIRQTRHNNTAFQYQYPHNHRCRRRRPKTLLLLPIIKLILYYYYRYYYCYC